MSHNATADDLDNALRLLDHELEGLHLDEPLQIRAIGGYALLKHGVRTGDRAYTADIDSVTHDYSAAVVQAIETVAEKTNLDPDWLNNYGVMDNDPDQIEAMYEAEWIPQDDGLRNIDMSIATVPTLTRAKIIAADSAEFSGRTRDVEDLMGLLEKQGITSAAQFERKYPDPYEEYPDAHAVVSSQFEGGKQQGSPDLISLLGASLRNERRDSRVRRADPFDDLEVEPDIDEPSREDNELDFF